MTRLFAIAAMLFAVWMPTRAQANACDVPSYIKDVSVRLVRVAEALNQRHALNVLVIGTGSSTLVGTDGTHLAYPARLEAALRAQLPDVAVKVSTDIKGRRTAADMAAPIQQLTLDEKPDLVIWQTGTVDAMRGVDPDQFRETLDKGVAAARAGGADVILVNMQYSPRTETMIAAQAYADAMHSVAQQQDVLLFDRLATMKYWSENGSFDLTSRARSQVAEKVHDCFGRVLADMIVAGAQIPGNHQKDQK